MNEYNAKIINIVDGDTVDARIDLGFSVFTEQRIRLRGIDAPETFRATGLELEAGLVVSDYLKSLLCRDDVIIKTYKIRQSDMFGRYLADIFIGKLNLNKNLLNIGFAKIYDRQKPQWTDEEFSRIVESEKVLEVYL